MQKHFRTMQVRYFDFQVNGKAIEPEGYDTCLMTDEEAMAALSTQSEVPITPSA
jgi:hypothetical protein